MIGIPTELTMRFNLHTRSKTLASRIAQGSN